VTATPPILDRPPRVTAAVAFVWAVAASIAESDAGMAFPTWMILAGAGVLLTMWWLFRLTAAVARRRGIRIAPSRAALAIWMALPVSLTIVLAAAATSTLLVARVALSAPALERSASTLAAVSPRELYTRPRRIGLFRVREFARFGRELRFLTSECGLVDNCGIVYSPDGPPQRRGEDSFTHLYGDWWHWYQSW
jgi:hypothetical protein